MAVPRTRIEQVAGIRPPLLRILQHYAHELTTVYTPHPRWMLKWIGIGLLLVVAASVVTILKVPRIEDDEAKAAANAAKAKLEEGKKQKAEDEKRRLRAEKGAAENKAITEMAVANWAQWKEAFVGPAIGTACYHEHDFKAAPKIYKITCHIGPKGAPPNLIVVCDEHSCGAPPPAKPPEKKE